jgi:hypothetical protein
MRRHDLLEIVVAEVVPPERLGAFLVVDLELASTVTLGLPRMTSATT